MKPLFPFALIGVTAACGAAIAHDAAPTQPAPLRCEVRLDAVAGGTRIEGRVIADQPVSGTYVMAMTSRSAGGSTTIRQAGDFEAAPGADAILSQTQLMGAPSRQQVDLEVRVGGRRLPCADPAL